MLTTARGRVAGDVGWDAAWEAKNGFWARLDDLLGDSDDPAAVYVGYAAADVVNTALYDLPALQGDDTAEPIQDEDLDPYEWDASYYAALAAAGGAPGEEGSDPERRRTFWRWYLSEAVPAAWATPLARTT